MKSESLIQTGFFTNFNKLSIIQKNLFLESVKKLQKISNTDVNVDLNCLLIFKDLFDTYQDYANKVRDDLRISMQSNIDACNA